MNAFELRWVELPSPVGRRPVMLLTRGGGYAYLNKVIVVEVTTTVRGIPQEVTLGPAEGVSRPSVANFDNVHVVARARIGARIGELAPSRHREAKRALGHALGWPELKVL
jgi:mRNA interferase MazF